MPTLANQTIKKADGTTDQLWTAIRGAQGPTVPAILRNLTPGTALAHKPELWMSSRMLSSGNMQELKVTAMWPQVATDTTTSLTKVVNRARFRGVWELPMDMPQTDRNEFAAQVANLLDTAVLVDSVKEGDAPTM